ncbi:MAG: hypothetical protein KIT84_07100 [Labilithrix sp.]|nr:hypothetical protein [Labilithrix sp.]MCW5810761.1 hypothetical protein [Labilithrix sp.]
MRDGSIVRVLEAETTPAAAHVYLVVPSHRAVPRRVEAFRDHLVRSFTPRRAPGSSP